MAVSNEGRELTEHRIHSFSLDSLMLEARTDWCISMFREAWARGAELLILGDDAADTMGPMISPALWRRLVPPFQSRILREAHVPVIWHSDGNIEPLLAMAAEVGFAGIHGLDPGAGVELARVKREFGAQLALFGNVAPEVLFGEDRAALRGEVRRAVRQGAAGPGYAFATCNSVHGGMNPALVREMCHGR